ncbi:ANTAR domain-containing protein [Streptomyces oryzae]|uniref:ANTAR domain-containing protein n=1 Tax=Streptomyces oryzae TaxID=1434886 RepID=UPI0027DE7B4B|nr:ANTAR domain-containing protein [Streptomyces oryzae]
MVGLAHRTALHRADELRQALGSRVVIEQAKGMLAERRRGSVEDAFGTLRAYARSRQRPLHQVARDVVEARLAGPPFERIVEPPTGP